MRSVTPQGATHNYLAPKNWDENKDGKCNMLHVRVQHVGESGLVEHVSAWRPTPEELAILNDGGAIEVGLLVPIQPPMRLGVTKDFGEMSYDEHGVAAP